MPDSVPQDVGSWLAKIAVEDAPVWNGDLGKQLQQVLKGKLFDRVWWKLAQRVEAMKTLMLRGSADDGEQLAELRRVQSEVRGIIAVLEIVWETAYEGE